jgi:hypothetical protein
MKASTDDVAYADAFLDTPFGSPRVRTNGGEVRAPRSADEAFRIPGCNVKSREKDGKDGRWPRYFGVLVSCSDDGTLCIVRSKPPTHGVDGKPTVWTGTYAEYASMWMCD